MNRRKVLLLLRHLRRLADGMLWLLGILYPPKTPGGTFTVRELYSAENYQRRRQHDALPGLYARRAFHAFTWIQNNRAMPQVRRKNHPCDRYWVRSL